MEALKSKLIVQLAFLAEKVDNGLGKKLEAAPTDDTDYKSYGYRVQICSLDSPVVFCPIVVSKDWLAAYAETDHNTDNDRVDLHNYAECGKRDIRTVNTLVAVGNKKIVHADNDNGRGKLRKKA